MIESLRRIGQLLLEAGKSDLPIEAPPKPKKKRAKGLIELVIFDLDEGIVNCDFVQVSEEKLNRFLWLGTVKGNKPQVFVTVDDIDYILGKEKEKGEIIPLPEHKHTFRAILREMNDMTDVEGIDELREVIKEILSKFFSGNEERWIGAFDGGNCDPKKMVGKDEEVVLFTPAVRKGGKVIAIVEMKGYINFLRHYLYKKGEKVRGTCHVCGRETEIFVDPEFREGTLLKMYVTDKKSFFPMLSESGEALTSVFGICGECKRQLIVGLNYIEKNFVLDLAGFKVHVIPTAAWIDLDKLDYISENALKRYLGRVPGFDSLKKVEDDLRNLRENLGSGEYWLNIIFGRRLQSAYRVIGFIQDVPTTRLLKIAEMIKEISSYAASDCGLGHGVLMLGGLHEIWGIFPTSKEEIKPFIRVISALYKGEALDYNWIIERGVLLAKIFAFNYQNYNITPDGGERLGYEWKIMRFSLLLRILEQMGVLNVPDIGMPNSNLPSLPNQIESYLSKMGYDAKRRALFLIGVLMARIGISQYKKGGSKPILEKLNYAGMSKERVMILSNQVFDALRVNRCLSMENEQIFSAMKTLLDSVLNELRDPIENVFYILSGYSFETVRLISGVPGSEEVSGNESGK